MNRNHFRCEIVLDFGLYYINLWINGTHTRGYLPENVTYTELKKACKRIYGFTLPNLKDLTFSGDYRKKYAYYECVA